MPMFEAIEQSIRDRRCPDCGGEITVLVWYNVQRRYNLASAELLEETDTVESDSWSDMYECSDCFRDCADVIEEDVALT